MKFLIVIFIALVLWRFIVHYFTPPKYEKQSECNPETCFFFKTIHYEKKNGVKMGKVPQACFMYKTCPSAKGKIQ